MVEVLVVRVGRSGVPGTVGVEAVVDIRSSWGVVEGWLGWGGVVVVSSVLPS